jgi:hypothetical protein
MRSRANDTTQEGVIGVRNETRYLILIGIVLLISACAGQQRLVAYSPMSARGGYQEEEIEPGVWRVLARSSGKAGAGYAWNMAEYRAGELLKARGFSHVQMLGRNGRWELSDELGGGQRRVLSDQMEVTVRGAHDSSAPTDCRARNADSCRTLDIEAMMAGIRPRLRFAHSGS